MTWVSLKVLHDLRVKIFNHILSQSLDFFNKAKIGSLISRVANDTRSARDGPSALSQMTSLTQPLTMICVIRPHDPYGLGRFTLYSLCLFPPLLSAHRHLWPQSPQNRPHG